MSCIYPRREPCSRTLWVQAETPPRWHAERHRHGSHAPHNRPQPV